MAVHHFSREKTSFLKYLLLILVCVLLLPSFCCSYELLLGTGGKGSFSYFAGKIVCRTIQKHDAAVTCRPVPLDNYTDSLTNLQGGSLDMALVNSKMIYDAFHREGLFEFIGLDYAQLRLLMPLYRVPISLVVRKGAKISSFDDLAGKKVNAGSRFSLQEIVFAELMSVKGWRESTFSLYQSLSSANSQDFMALHNGSVQAMLHIGMHPDERLASSLKTGYTDIVTIGRDAVDRLAGLDSGFYRQSIPGRSYQGYLDDIETLALETLLVTSSDVDNETISLVLEAIVSAKKQLRYAHPALLENRVTVETLNSSYLHPHPEAILFFQVNQSRLE